MLNAKALSNLLSHNRHDRLCKRWCLMTPHGTILAHSQPTDINHLRKHAAIAAITWQEHAARYGDTTIYNGDDASRSQGNGEGGGAQGDGAQRGALHVLIMESEGTDTILMRRLQDQLLLVLEGGAPPRRSACPKNIIAETVDGAQLRPRGSDADAMAPTGTDANVNENDMAANVLKLQRKKLDALAEAILSDFRQTGFRMPEHRPPTVF